mmetsp:Transcript_14945/g.21137  ORF Transcript_14945/g.21137 Transcript_14945/m.21137 type:complete len:94 (+) Transcript_14945:291-572(+)
MTTSSQEDQVTANKKASHEALTECLLKQFYFCGGGVGLGAAYGIKRRAGAMPMVIGGLAGTAADFIYGYTVACKDEAQNYEKSKSSSSGPPLL